MLQLIDALVFPWFREQQRGRLLRRQNPRLHWPAWLSVFQTQASCKARHACPAGWSLLIPARGTQYAYGNLQWLFPAIAR